MDKYSIKWNVCIASHLKPVTFKIRLLHNVAEYFCGLIETLVLAEYFRFNKQQPYPCALK